MKNLKLSFIIVCIIVIGIVACSCSSKKKITEVKKEQIKIENSQESENSENSETNIKVDIITKVDDKTKTVTTKKTMSPIDNTKPASVTDPDGKKHDLNNATLTEETTTEEANKKTEYSNNSAKVHKKESAASASTKAKAAIEILAKKEDLDKSGFNFWSWFWLAGFVMIGVMLFYLNHHFKVVKRVTAFLSK